MPLTAPYRRVLAATDFSPHAEAAVRQAVWVARHAACPLGLVHVLPDVQAQIASLSYELLQGEFPGDDAEKFERKRRRDAERRLKESSTPYRAMRGRIAAQVLLGTPFVEIIQLAQSEGYDLTVMGTRGHSALRQFLLGSTAQRLIRNCPGDVWVVKRAEEQRLESVLVSVDYSAVSGRALWRGAWLARQAGAKLHVLHVADSADVPADLLAGESGEAPRQSMRKRIQLAAQEHLGAFLQKHLPPGVEAEPHFSWGTSWKEIVRAAGRLSADLVVMGTVGRSGISGLFLGNTAERVLAHCDANILTVKPEGFVTPIRAAQETPVDVDS